jgi:hypothetical protein
MLIRHRTPGIDPGPAQTVQGLEHLRHERIAVLRWLVANRVEQILTGPIAEAIRGRQWSDGPVAIVPAPYGRNYERLARALWSEHARVRIEGESDTTPVRISADKLARGGRWMLRCGTHDLDIEGRPAGAPRYQELLYEATRFEIEPGLSVEVASPEDLEHFGHVRRTGSAPEIRITRASQAEPAQPVQPVEPVEPVEQETDVDAR